VLVEAADQIEQWLSAVCANGKLSTATIKCADGGVKVYQSGYEKRAVKPLSIVVLCQISVPSTASVVFAVVAPGT
jgi:hypothetical protein